MLLLVAVLLGVTYGVLFVLLRLPPCPRGGLDGGRGPGGDSRVVWLAACGGRGAGAVRVAAAVATVTDENPTGRRPFPLEVRVAWSVACYHSSLKTGKVPACPLEGMPHMSRCSMKSGRVASVAVPQGHVYSHAHARACEQKQERAVATSAFICICMLPIVSS